MINISWVYYIPNSVISLMSAYYFKLQVFKYKNRPVILNLQYLKSKKTHCTRLYYEFLTYFSKFSYNYIS